MIQTLLGRAGDLEYVRRHATAGTCCSIVGVSNLGKSALLRRLCEGDAPMGGTFVYVDCNQMGERTARAFFTATWRALATRLAACARESETHALLQRWSDEMVAAPTLLAAQLAFADGLAFALDRLPLPLILCLDEFDEVYQHLEPQAFLNLRALKDRHGAALVYVTATERELARLTATREQGEFYELIMPRVRFIRFWDTADARLFCECFAQREHVTFDDTDRAFIWENAGGHPGLTQAVCYALGAVTGAPLRDAQQNRVIHQVAQANLATDIDVQAECKKIWEDLEADERDALLELRRADPNSTVVRGLSAKSIVCAGEEEPAMFARLFADFVHRQKLVHQPNARGVYMDADAGAVWVEGRALETLSELEYRLLLFLYGRLDRVCDKYAIVAAVWGEEYIDQVDDARIEKLISRVRQKIEPDPAHPRYLISVRGRGYKLVR